MSVVTDILNQSLDMAMFCVKAYLDDLTDAQLLIRPAEGANHIAWQLGHLINSENQLVGQVCPGSMPDLPAGFADKYTKETAKLDDPSAFHTKAEYLKLMDEQVAATKAALATLSEEDLRKPAPEAVREFCPTVGDVFALEPSHWFMHSGQWVIVRRQLGKPALF